MLEIEVCRICLHLADGIKMYPIKHTRYHEIFNRFTQDMMDINEDLPYSVCYLCNAVLNKLYIFLKNMIDTEIYLKETLRNTSKLTIESVEKFKREMISKPHNLSPQKIYEIEEIKEEESNKIKDSKLPQQASKSPHRLQKESSENTEQNLNSLNMEIDDSILIFLENKNSTEQSNHVYESSFSNKISKTPDPIDSFLLSAQRYIPPEEITKSCYGNVTEEAATTHCPYEFIEERIPIEKEPQAKKGQKVPNTALCNHAEDRSTARNYLCHQCGKLIMIFESILEMKKENPSTIPGRVQKESETTADQVDCANDDDDEVHNMRLAWSSSDSENGSPSVLNMDIEDELCIVNNKSSEQSDIEVKIESVDEEFQYFFEENPPQRGND